MYKETEELKGKLIEYEELKKQFENTLQECLEKTIALDNLQNILEDAQAQYDSRLNTKLNVLQMNLTNTQKELNSSLLKIEELEKINQQFIICFFNQ